MRCFSNCFGVAKYGKAPKKVSNSSFPKHHHHHQLNDFQGESPRPNTDLRVSNSGDLPTLESKDKYNDELNNIPKRKVATDSDVKANEISNISLQNNRNEEEIQEESRGNIGDYQQGNTICSAIIISKEEKKIEVQSSDSLAKMVCYGQTKEKKSSSSEIESEENGDHFAETSESLFSVSIGSRKHINDEEIDDKEVNSAITFELHRYVNDQDSFDVCPVENPILSKKDANDAKNYDNNDNDDDDDDDDDKENVNLGQEVNVPIPFSEEEPSFKKLNPNLKEQKANGSKPEDLETSLSSWLSEAGKSLNSSSKFEDRPILGALSIGEIKEPSVTSTPRRLASCYSPDELPISGSVASYWTKTSQKIDSSDSERSCCRLSNKFNVV